MIRRACGGEQPGNRQVEHELQDPACVGMGPCLHLACVPALELPGRDGDFRQLGLVLQLGEFACGLAELPLEGRELLPVPLGDEVPQCCRLMGRAAAGPRS